MTQSPWNPSLTAPQKMSDDHLQQFVDLVIAGGGVESEGLPERVRQALALVTIRDGEVLAAVAAIKNPSAYYRQGLFEKAGVGEQAEAYSLELGWISVGRDYRGRHCTRPLVQAAIGAAGDRALFATTRSDRIRRVLPDYGFAVVGSPYRSELEPDEELSLYVRPPALSRLPAGQ